MNQELYNQFLNAAVIMVEAQRCDKLLNECYDYIELNEDMIKEKKYKMDNSKSAYRKTRVWGLILMIAGPVLALSTCGEKGMEGIGVFFFIHSFVGVFLFMLGRIKRQKYMKQAKKDYEETKEFAEQEIKEELSKVDEIKAGLREYANKNEHLIAFLPSNYRNPNAINFMLNAIKNLRANTLTDVINLYEQELHLLEQERLLKEVVQTQQQLQEQYYYSMLEIADTIRNNQDQINSNLRTIQTLQFLNMFND